jgi:hypothetical protein
VDIAREERRPDFLFELLDALADRGLRPAHSFRCSRERAFFDDCQEVFELEQIHE